MKRILVIGSAGAGKSHFSRRLSDMTGIEVTHLDRTYWKPGWVKPDNREFDSMLRHLMERQSWIFDGNYGRTLEWRLSKAEAAILLDLGRILCTLRILKRLVLYGDGRRVDMAEGCDERLDLEFLKWTWDYPKHSRGSVLDKLLRGKKGKKIFRLRSRKDVNRFLNEVKATGDIAKVEFGLWK